MLHVVAQDLIHVQTLPVAVLGGHHVQTLPADVLVMQLVELRAADVNCTIHVVPLFVDVRYGIEHVAPPLDALNQAKAEVILRVFRQHIILMVLEAVMVKRLLHS